MSKFFIYTIKKRLSGAMCGAFIFFIITNFGVWSSGFYGYSIDGLIECYFLAIPFFVNTLVSTIIFSALIELVYNFLPKSIRPSKIN